MPTTIKVWFQQYLIMISVCPIISNIKDLWLQGPKHLNCWHLKTKSKMFHFLYNYFILQILFCMYYISHEITYFKKNFKAPFHGLGSTALKVVSRYEETIYFLPQCPTKLLVLIWSTSERWKSESTLEPPCCLNTRHLNWKSSTLNTRPLLQILN